MTQSIRVPDPVYDALSMESEQQDISRGAVVKQWMEQAEKYRQMEGRHR